MWVFRESLNPEGNQWSVEQVAAHSKPLGPADPNHTHVRLLSLAGVQAMPVPRVGEVWSLVPRIAEVLRGTTVRSGSMKTLV